MASRDQTRMMEGEMAKNADSRREQYCENCARSTEQEVLCQEPYVPSWAPSAKGAWLLTYRCGSCGNIQTTLQIDAQSELISRVGPPYSPEKDRATGVRSKESPAIPWLRAGLLETPLAALHREGAFVLRLRPSG